MANYSNSTANTIISGTSSADSIYNSGASVQIYAESGQDSITNYGSNSTIYGGNANDLINNYAGNVKIYGESGADSINNYGNANNTYTTIYSGAGNDYIYNTGSYSSINGGNGNDTIHNYYYYGSLTGESGRNVTITGGAGNDSIYFSRSYSGYSGSNKVQYAAGDGNDTIYGLTSYDTLQITGAEYTTTKSGSDLIIGVGDNSILVQNGANSSFKIDGTLAGSEDELPDGWKFTSTLASASVTSADDLDLTEDYGADIIRVNASKLTSGVQIIGNDLDNSIKGGKGADTIHGGEGNDTISLGGGADVYVYSGGNDYIRDYAEGADKISLESGSISGASVSDSDVILNVSGGGNITLKNAKDKAITIIDSRGNETSNVYPLDEEDELPDGWKFSETLASATLATADDLDLTEDYGEDIIRVNASKTTNGIEIIGNDLDNSIKGGKGADTIHGGEGNDTISLGGGADVYVYSGGNDYIRDYAEGADKISLESGSISGASVSDSNVILNISGGGNITLKNAKDKAITIIDSRGRETSNVYPIENNTTPDGWKFTSTLASATLATADDLDLTEAYGEDIIRVNAYKTTNGIEIIGNDLDNSIKGGKGADTIHGGAGNDTISLGGGADVYVYSGGNDYIRDYAEGADKISLESGSISGASVSDSNVILNISGGGNITLKNAKDKAITIIDSKGKETSNVYPIENNTTPDGWKFTSTLASATLATADDLDLTEAYGEDIIRVNAYKTTNGIEIIGNDLDNSIKGGKGADTIHGGAGNDTVSLGGGADVYVYSGGNDYIRDYAEGVDKISLESGSISGASVSDSNVILNVSGGGNITLKNAKDKAITIIDSRGNETSNVYPLDEEDELPDGWKFSETLASATLATADDLDLTEDYGEDIIRVNASKTTNGIEIIGNDLDNSIKGGKGADTIHGGEGNDTISLGGGADVYVYSGGNDYIRDYAEGADKISLESGSISGASISDSNVILNVSGGGNITLKNAKDKAITIIDSRGNETSNVYPLDEEDELPDGWKFSETLASATLATADDLDLTEDYGEDIIRVNASKTTNGIEIIGNDLDNSIKGGKGADTIHGGAGNDTVSLGGGADVYVYSGGKDYIRDYAEGADKISLESGSISGASVSDSNVILNISGGGNITLKNAKDKAITIIDSRGRETSNVYPVNGDTTDSGISVNGTTLTASSSFSGKTIDLTDYNSVTNVNASAVSQGVSIIGTSANNSLSGGKSRDTINGGAGKDSIFGNNGNDILYGETGNDYIDGGSGADTIYGGAGRDSIFGDSSNDKLYGDAGNDYIDGGNGADTLYGGTGNDTLTGGNGKDIFVYDSGKDIITDYSAGQDSIQIESGTISNTSYSGNNVIFTIGSGSLTVQNGKGKKITITDSNGNTTTQTYSNSRTLDLLLDNNFMTDDSSLDDITEAKYTVTDIQDNKVDDLAQDSSILAYSEDK